MNPVPYGHRALTLQGIRSTSIGYPYEITSSNSSIVRIHKGNKIIPLSEGEVSLSFIVPENAYYVASEKHLKRLKVVAPTRSAWIEYRKQDVRYARIQDRFASRLTARDANKSYPESLRTFDEDYADSDGDGYSNLFERAMGLDSLGPDNPQHLPNKLMDGTDGKQRISFIRYKNSIQTTGEDFRYKVEGSSNLRTWSGMNVVLETTKTVDLGGVWKGSHSRLKML